MICYVIYGFKYWFIIILFFGMDLIYKNVREELYLGVLMRSVNRYLVIVEEDGLLNKLFGVLISYFSLII